MRPKKARKSSRKIHGDPKKKLRIKTFYFPNPFYTREGKKISWQKQKKLEAEYKTLRKQSLGGRAKETSEATNS